MKEGDIYRWWFKKPRDHMPYHCCSQIAVMRKGVLKDTYWSELSDGRNWTPEGAEAELELEFVANFDEIESTREDVRSYYDEADIVDLGHANNNRREHMYLRKGAKRSAAVMRETLQHAIERSESEIRMAQSRIDRAREQLAKIDSGDLSGWIESMRGR
jgi:hypothetical protein